MEKNKTRKGFAIAKREDLTEKLAFELRPEGGLKFVSQ